MRDLSEVTTYQSGVLQSTAHRLTMRVKTEFLTRYQLTCMQWFVIGHVYDSEDAGIRLTDLMKILDTTMPFITTLVSGLEARKIIHKSIDISDSRVKIATLNPDYRQTVEEIEEGLRQELRDQLYVRDGITREELQTYIRVITKMAQQEE